MGDVRVVALDLFRQCGTFRVLRVTALHDRARSMFFRGVQLCKARPLDTRLPVVATRGHLLLLDTILHDPHLRAVLVGSVTNDHDLKDWIIGREFQFVMELSDQWAKLLEESDAHGLQVRLTLAGSGLVTRVAPGDPLKIPVQPNGLWISRNAPFRSSEEHADVRGVQVHHARWNGISLHRLIDGRKDDGVLRHVNNGAPASEIGDDFVLVRFLGKSVNRRRAEEA